MRGERFVEELLTNEDAEEIESVKTNHEAHMKDLIRKLHISRNMPSMIQRN